MNLFSMIKSKIVCAGLILFFMSLIAVSGLFYFGYRVTESIGTKLSTTSVELPAERMKKIVLKNGMHVLVFKNQSAPKVLVQIAYNIGSAVEEAGERGLAHLIEHLIFKGTDRLSETDIAPRASNKLNK